MYSRLDYIYIYFKMEVSILRGREMMKEWEEIMFDYCY